MRGVPHQNIVCTVGIGEAFAPLDARVLRSVDAAHWSHGRRVVPRSRTSFRRPSKIQQPACARLRSASSASPTSLRSTRHS